MRVRYEKTEAARKALAEKYKNMLEGYDETLASPMRRLNVTVTPGRRKTEVMKTPAQKRKERRQTMFTPKSAAGRKSHAFKPLLFDDSSVDAEEADAPGNLEQDADMVEERELLRLEMDNNRLSQIVNEKDSQIAGLCEKQKEQANEWLAEKQTMLETESALKSQLEEKKVENNGLQEKLADERQRNEVLSAKISAGNDERCRLQQQIDSLNTEKFDLEDRLQMLQNEQEQLVSEFRSMTELEMKYGGLEEQLHFAQQNIAASSDRARHLEEKIRSQEALLERQNEELSQVTAALERKNDEQNELTGQIEEYKALILSKDEELHKLMSTVKAKAREEKKWLHEKAELEKEIGVLQDINNRLEMEREDEVNEVKNRYVTELSFIHNEADTEKAAHEKTKAELESQIEVVDNLRGMLHVKENELEELHHQLDMSNEVISQKEQKVAEIEKKREEEINKLKKRHTDELKNMQSQIELEQSAHSRTRQQFTEFRQSAQETFEKKMEELKETFSKKERRMTVDMDEREAQLIQLRAEKESCVCFNN
ncbi:hypothetical protein OESDEN_19971 [Oesophagostomum dentatum]|uniref:Uncharacterized protein n=1 Tax=Oesophagostomum dentatum TaxID=61180 RepID=A0A0B1SAU4_OESDE|nr:hypothetical protein OESDEN_19971 [Oesophagostomum dentatum]